MWQKHKRKAKNKSSLKIRADVVLFFKLIADTFLEKS